MPNKKMWDADLQRCRSRKTLERSLARIRANIQFHSFTNLEDNVRRQVGKIKNHPLIPKEIPVTGLVYEVESGLLRKVE
ncbi:MAG TPA: hypothetical protein VNE86_05915 [Nitrososphaerales archaeon]|nr:hypothetical protein [Nitrososphaerales archaeon]